MIRWLACGAPLLAGAQSFDGVTVIGLSDLDAAAVISGRIGGNFRHLVVYVSAAGTYASITDQTKRACVAWAQEGSYTGDAITFGVVATERSVGLTDPRVCQPFTLTFDGVGNGGDVVRIDAKNPVGASGPLFDDAQVVTYSRRQSIVARAPLIAVDWASPLYEAYRVNAVSLGPIPAVRANLGADAQIEIHGFTNTYEGGARKALVIQKDINDPIATTTLYGVVAASDHIGWPWDTLYGARTFRRYPQESTVDAFDAAVLERFGEPTLKLQPWPTRAARDWFWLFDLDGKAVAGNDLRPDNCLATKPAWEIYKPLYDVNDDVGPWSCALVVHMVDNAGVHGTVSTYDLEAMSGYTAALNHFAWRLGQTAGIRARIEAVKSRKVEL